jgi:hypothetical protein
MGDALTREQIERLKTEGIEYPWDPRQSLALLGRLDGVARWLGDLQKALPDDCEFWLPRSVRCPFCGTRLSSGYHETDCRVRKAARQ